MFLTYLTMDACYWQEDVRQNSQSSDLTTPCICWPESSQHHVFALPGRACNMAWEDVDEGWSSHAKVIKSLILLARVAFLEMSGGRRNGESCGMICSKLTYKREKCLKSIQKKSMLPFLCGSQRPAMLVKLLKSKNLALTNVINVQEWKWQVARSWDALSYESQWAWNTEVSPPVPQNKFWGLGVLFEAPTGSIFILFWLFFSKIKWGRVPEVPSLGSLIWG